MSSLMDALNDGEYELVVEALARLRETKVKAFNTARETIAAAGFTRRDFGIEAIDTVLKKLDVKLDDPAAENTAAAPRIGIKMEGGVIQNVFADVPVEVTVINYDVEDASPPEEYSDPECGVCKLEQDDGDTAECVLTRYGAEVAPGWFPRLDVALAEHAQRLEDRDTAGPKP